MDNFRYTRPTEVIFGKGTENEVGMEVKKYADKVLLHYGGGSVKKSGLFDRVVDSLKKAGVSFVELGGVVPNPRLSLVREGIDICRRENIKMILAVGGGSVIDSSKAIAIGTPAKCDVWDFFMAKEVPQEALKVGVVLTISAAGSETSVSAVITNEDGWIKRGLNSDFHRPVFAIMNPELVYTLPQEQIACGATDMLAHVMERYFTRTTNVELTDRMCEAVMKTIINNAPIAVKDPDNYNAQAELMWAGSVAHCNLLSTGRVGDFASHQIEHELSALYDVPHGAGLAVIFPAWMKYVYKTDIPRFTRFANSVWNVELNYEDPETTALEGIRKMESFFKSIGMPVTLKELGVPSDSFEEMAEKCVTGRDLVGKFVPLAKEDIIEIYKLAKG